MNSALVGFLFFGPVASRLRADKYSEWGSSSQHHDNVKKLKTYFLFLSAGGGGQCTPFSFCAAIDAYQLLLACSEFGACAARASKRDFRREDGLFRVSLRVWAIFV